MEWLWVMLAVSLAVGWLVALLASEQDVAAGGWWLVLPVLTLVLLVSVALAS